VKRPIVVCVTCSALILGLSACTNPYDPAQRFVGGGVLGAASGAAIGAAAGAFGGVATTPPPYGLGYPGYPGYYAYPLITLIPRITLITAIPVITAITDSDAQPSEPVARALASDKF